MINFSQTTGTSILKRMFSVAITVFCCFTLYSQEQANTTPAPVIEQTPSIFDIVFEPIPGYGTVRIQQDDRLVTLLNNHKALNIQNESKIQGWRVQIYNSSGVDSRKEAEEIRRKFLERYPDATVYVIYQPPFFKIRVGDFRTREDAYMLYKQIVNDFPISYLVNDMIQLPRL
ncbi:MAG TPA: SPOR domain-containing protein [Bacteroidales bacterium]|nr:SPOR domain-containing protein [Bacteroidales bacterium]